MIVAAIFKGPVALQVKTFHVGNGFMHFRVFYYDTDISLYTIRFSYSSYLKPLILKHLLYGHHLLAVDESSLVHHSK